MTFDQVKAIRETAHKMGFGSIALATVLQFELSLRQKDVIGEWEPAPLTEGGIVHRDTRWTNGLQWSDIDSAMILRKTHTKTGAYVEFTSSFILPCSRKSSLCHERSASAR